MDEHRTGQTSCFCRNHPLRLCYDNRVWLTHGKETEKCVFVSELLSQTLLNLIWDLENVAAADGCFGKRKKKKKSCLCVTCVLSHAVCAEAFNPDEDEEEKEPLVIIALFQRSFFVENSSGFLRNV